MEGIIWNCFKNRMGVSAGIVMGFDLNALLQPIDGLEFLTEQFTKEEMDDTVKHMPIDKAPGPDGFNGLFSRNVGTLFVMIFMSWLKLFIMALQSWRT